MLLTSWLKDIQHCVRRQPRAKRSKPWYRGQIGFQAEFGYCVEQLEDRRLLALSRAPIEAWAYVDMNSDGIPQQNESRIEGATITLTVGDSRSGSTSDVTLQTDKNGRAYFGDWWSNIGEDTVTVMHPDDFGAASVRFHRIYWNTSANVPPYQSLSGIGPDSITFIQALYRDDYLV